MFRAIVTKYLGATNHRPARIYAKVKDLPGKMYAVEALEGESVYAGVDLANDVHERAAKKYAELIGWSGMQVSGMLTEDEAAHVFMG